MLRQMVRIAKKSGAYHHGDLRRVLLATAARVIEEEGVSALSLQRLSRRAGVSSAAPYHHFDSREVLLASLAEQGFELLVAEMKRAAAEAEPSAAAQLHGLGVGYMRFALAHRGHFRVMFRAELHAHKSEPGAPPKDEALLLLRRAIERGQAEGLAAAGDPMPLVLLAWSSVHGASALWIDGSLRHEQVVLDEASLVSSLCGTVVRLVCAQPALAEKPASTGSDC